MYIRVHVVPGARREQIIKKHATEYHIAVREPAERNCANKRIREILSREFEIPIPQVRLLTGHRSSVKMYSIDV